MSMQAYKIQAVVDDDRSVTLRDLPFNEGDRVEVILVHEEAEEEQTRETVGASDLVGLWTDRDDTGNSAEHARTLREQAERRSRGGN